jgi:hypothetical protein
MSALPLASTAVLALVLVALGSRFRGLLAGAGDGAGFRLVLYAAAGGVLYHLLLTLLQAAGLPWNPFTLAAGLAGLIAGGAALHQGLLRRGAQAAGRARWESEWGWGDGLALFALAVFTCFALALWVTTPDFVYHWGLKGHRFFLAGGIDYADLGRVWNEVIHPDYPNLLPELYAGSALLAGRFAEPAMMLWSSFFFALLLLAAREALRRAGCRPFVRQATVAVLALCVAGFALGGLMAGAADWLIALALVAAAPLLAQPPSPVRDRQLGVLAALAAASKVEGVPLAAFLILTALLLPRGMPRGPRDQGDRQGRGDRDAALDTRRRLAELALPAAAVALPWFFEVQKHHLFQAFNSGPFDPARAPRVAAALLTTLGDPAWHGFSWAVVLLPLLGLDRRLRPLATVALLQLAFYVYVYFTVRIDAAALVLASFPRLLLHLVPATLLGLAIAAGQPAAAEAEERRRAMPGPVTGEGGESVLG